MQTKEWVSISQAVKINTQKKFSKGVYTRDYWLAAGSSLRKGRFSSESPKR